MHGIWNLTGNIPDHETDYAETCYKQLVRDVGVADSSLAAAAAAAAAAGRYWLGQTPRAAVSHSAQLYRFMLIHGTLYWSRHNGLGGHMIMIV